MVWGFQSFNPYGNLTRREIQEIERPGYWDVPGPSQIEGEYDSEAIADYMDNIEPIVITSEEAFMWWVQEIASYLTSLFLLIILINKFILKKEYEISSKEVGFMFLMLLKINFPIISIVTMCLSAPPALKVAQRWLHFNVNKKRIRNIVKYIRL